MITYLLAVDERGDEHVSQYIPEEMTEIFSDAQRADLAAGRKAVIVHRGVSISYIDMKVAARAAMG